MKDLIENLRNPRKDCIAYLKANARIAADELERIEAENAQLKAAMQDPDRHAIQLEGKHPSPCAKFCEATAFLIQERGNKKTIERLSKQLEVSLVALDQIANGYVCNLGSAAIVAGRAIDKVKGSAA